MPKHNLWPTKIIYKSSIKVMGDVNPNYAMLSMQQR